MSFDEKQRAKEKFRVLEILPQKTKLVSKTKQSIAVAKSREVLMQPDQDWPSIWPGPRSFHPHTVPLPLRQGFVEGKGPAPDKYNNAELLKIPNFLHLTPPAVKRHCEALKKFCTKWPEGLDTEEDCEKHFPIEIITSDYCYSSPTIREPLARIVSLKIKLSSLKLDIRAKDKILRLLGNRYNVATDMITIVADRCPTRKQNLDYVHYLLTAVYHEARRIEPWEELKSQEDMEYFDWDKSKSRETLVSIHRWPSQPTDNEYKDIPNAKQYKTAVEELVNNGENDESVNQYKNAVLNVLNLRTNVEC